MLSLERDVLRFVKLFDNLVLMLNIELIFKLSKFNGSILEPLCCRKYMVFLTNKNPKVVHDAILDALLFLFKKDLAQNRKELSLVIINLFNRDVTKDELAEGLDDVNDDLLALLGVEMLDNDAHILG